ncbi:MAG TPA: methyl-accepting chemotaxis protein, partial [Spirochaetota bacterium]|nr:methyl-accepting chemotaxis protein [Spirochaetota bacterium]
EIASTIEEATAAINQNSENAVKAKQFTEEGAVKSVQTNGIALEAVTSINEMNESSKKVVDIIALIDEIAFQTNLLALNAAIEAARAGEQGKGFAVVANEVRTLAQRSGNAAKEIETLIKETVKKVEISTELVNKTSSALNDIEVTAKTTAQAINEIAMASVEQKQGINQINIAISDMDNMTQQNAALVEETASASEEMANQAVELLEMVKKFKLGDKHEINTIKGEHEIHLSSALHHSSLGSDHNSPGNGKKMNSKVSPEKEEYDDKNMNVELKKNGYSGF